MCTHGNRTHKKKIYNASASICGFMKIINFEITFEICDTCGSILNEKIKYKGETKEK